MSHGDNGAFVIADGPTDPQGGKFTIDASGNVSIANDLVIKGKMRLPEGPDTPTGQVPLVNGLVVVTNNSVSPASRIFLTHSGAVGQLGVLYVGTITKGVSFEICSSSPTDHSPVNYWIIN